MYQSRTAAHQLKTAQYQLNIAMKQFLSDYYQYRNAPIQMRDGRRQAMNTRQAKKAQKGKGKIAAEELKAVTLEITRVLQNNLHIFINAENAEKVPAGRERQRLFGAGVKNYGFIEKAFAIARENPDYMPPHLDVGGLRNCQDDLEELRQLFFIVKQFAEAVSFCYLQRSDMCYRLARRIYAGLKEQGNSRVEGAAALYEALKPFFHRRKRQTGALTQKQYIKTAKKLIQGKADGEMIIKNAMSTS
jgi:hypothetical protein